jgi:hypothetical protein
MAMAAMIRMIATTIRSSMRENPFCGFFIVTLPDLDVSFPFLHAKSFCQFIESNSWATPVMAPPYATDSAAITRMQRHAGKAAGIAGQAHRFLEERQLSNWAGESIPGRHKLQEIIFRVLLGPSARGKKEEEAKLPPRSRLNCES